MRDDIASRIMFFGGFVLMLTGIVYAKLNASADSPWSTIVAPAATVLFGFFCIRFVKMYDELKVELDLIAHKIKMSP